MSIEEDERSPEELRASLDAIDAAIKVTEMAARKIVDEFVVCRCLGGADVQPEWI